MTALDDWPRVKRVLAEALEREGAERQAYLAEACGSDAGMRARVERLLAVSQQAAAFLEAPTAALLEPEALEDLSGCVVDCYRLVSRLGAGGTGQVYRAHDTKLDRPVALKFLSPQLTADPDRVRRFHQEARAASSLNHPHILVVHDFGELAGRPYLVTELIEGETLRQRLGRGRLATGDVVDIGVQVAGALAAAHARGLVHRDVKPENVMVRPDGYAKVLDFGLAKLAAETTAPGAHQESRTRTGTVLGTPRYMSPEQARGLELDARTDVWSLGVVLYEMATGALPFARDGSFAIPSGIPSGLLRVICTALHTVRDLRYPSGAELCADLKGLQLEMASAGPGQASGLAPRRLALAASLGLALAALAILLPPRRDGGGSPAPGATASTTPAQPRSAEAYALYLKSLGLSTDPGPNREAVALLERASALDPEHADTWVALSARYYANGYYSAGGIEEMRRSEEAARRALAIDPGHVAAAVRLSLLQLGAGGRLQDLYDGAQRLVAQNPDSGEAHLALSRVLRYGGLLEESARECDEALSRDPTNPRFRGCSAGLMLLGRYDRALDFIRLDAGSEASRLLARLVYQRMGRRHDAREEHRMQSPDYPSGLVPAGFHGLLTRCLSGPAPDGRARLSDDDVRTFLTRQSDAEPLYFFASDLAYCGDTGAALRLLRESIRRNYCAAAAVETDPTFAAIRGRPELAELRAQAQACIDRFREHVRSRTAPRAS